MKTSEQCQTYLEQYGYFHCPEVSERHTKEEIAERTDDVIETALAKWQDVFAPDLDEFTRKYHRRPSNADGDEGPATYDAMNLPRCGHPDFQSAVAEQARFPDRCRERITTSYRMNLSGLTPEQLREYWIEAGALWERKINVKFVLQLENYPRTNVYAFEARLGGNVLADQYLSQGGCGDQLRGRFDNRNWNKRLFVPTCGHERGHALGYGHVTSDRTALMYPSITEASMNRGGEPNESDIRAVLSIGYRRRTEPIPPDDDTPTDPKKRLIHEFNYRGEQIEIYATGKGGDDGWVI